ncbi:unnamed protein product [Arabis nemorensis]|uniref:Uncharacterized protein n=1 Tax=Arabis nemorensis TaxID=586526 RepID=A0A565CVE8_9BRAS|nr:unnamed protein product [Arabis nemorensis]
MEEGCRLGHVVNYGQYDNISQWLKVKVQRSCMVVPDLSIWNIEPTIISSFLMQPNLEGRRACVKTSSGEDEANELANDSEITA